ncbi:Hypothetical predicted protein [Octopus vulgaris]|uniref:Uncharacterized protein n=1 Tax=Octopus vulgaris TaxID=6645 RepID=A0AA36BIF9_OCTVU|nr:Hypothetical predicted protein [Octopus vulgaris]
MVMPVAVESGYSNGNGGNGGNDHAGADGCSIGTGAVNISTFSLLETAIVELFFSFRSSFCQFSRFSLHCSILPSFNLSLWFPH